MSVMTASATIAPDLDVLFDQVSATTATLFQVSASVRRTVSDSSAFVAVMDRRKTGEADIRVGKPKKGTIHHCANAIAHREGVTREEVLERYGLEDSKTLRAPAQLRARWLALQGR